MATEGGFLDLPRPVVVGVLRFLPLRSLVAARCIAKRLADIVDEALRSRDCLDVRDQDGPATNLAIQWLQRNAAVMTNVKQLHAAGNVLLTSLTALANASAGAEVLRRLTRLTVDSCKCLTDKDLPGVLELCGNLEALDFSGCGKLSDASALTVGRCCPGVKELGLADWHTLTDDALDYLSRHCPLLEACVVDGCIRVTTKGVRALAANCRGLRRLSTQRCCAITDAALSALAASTCTELVLRQCPKLRGLGALRSLRLEVLDITGCPRINDDELRAALEGAGPTLNTLVLNGCVGLSGDVLSVVAALCPRLQSLSVRGIGSITNAHLHALAAAGCTTLLELNTIWCNKVRARLLRSASLALCCTEGADTCTFQHYCRTSTSLNAVVLRGM